MHYRMIESHLSLDYLNKYANGDTFIETGTYRGDTIWLALECDKFKRIHSIELNKELYDIAVATFRHKHNVKIWHGDSAECIMNVQQQLGPGPATYWLDAHASGPLAGGKSGGTPVLDELRLIRDFAKHLNELCTDTIFIDDRRLFGSAEWSGVTEEQALEVLKEINPDYRILHLDGFVEKDILCATVVPE